MTSDKTDGDFHTNAAALIVAAAEKSGLLREVAEAPCFIEKHGRPSVGCAACELLDRLTDAFDDHTCLGAVVVERFWGEGTDIGPLTETELAPYLTRDPAS